MILDEACSLESLGLGFNAKGWTGIDSVATTQYAARDDKQLESLSLLFNTGYMHQLLRAALKPGNPLLSIENVSIAYSRYKPSRYCQIAYNLKTRQRRCAKQQHFVLVGRLEPATRLRLKSDSVLVINPGSIQSGSADIDTPGTNQLVLCLFPHDLRLRNLSRMLIRKHLADIVNSTEAPLSLAPSKQPAPCSWAQILSYRPERYCMIHYKTSLPASAGNAVVARMVHDPKAAINVWKSLNRLWRQPSTISETVAEPVHHDQDLAISWQRALTGQSLTELIIAQADPVYIDSAARALASLHGHYLPALHYTGPMATSHSVHQDLEHLSIHDTRVGELASKTSDWLRQRQPEERKSGPMIHGDYSASQILCDNNSSQLLDLSGISGDPERDLANFTARLEHHLDNKRFKLINDRFSTVYSRCAAAEACPVRTNWYLAVSEIRNGLTWIKRCRRGADAFMQQQLIQALARLQASTKP